MEWKLAEWRARQRTLEKPPSDSSFRRSCRVFSALWNRLRRDESESQQRPRDTAESRVSEDAGPGGPGQPFVKKEDGQNWFQERFVTQPVESDHAVFTIVTILKFLLWLVLLGLFVELEFGLAYFVLSMFYWIYIGTRDPSKKKQGEISAYSVFNPGCKAIEGSLTAEQFERELQYRPLAGR